MLIPRRTGVRLDLSDHISIRRCFVRLEGCPEKRVCITASICQEHLPARIPCLITHRWISVSNDCCGNARLQQRRRAVITKVLLTGDNSLE